MRKLAVWGVVAFNLLVWSFAGGTIAIRRHWLPNPFASDECAAPHADVVPFHQGMTLCPGQSAIMQFEIPVAPATPGPAGARDPERRL